MLESTQSFRQAKVALKAIAQQIGNTTEVQAIAQYLIDSAIAVYPPMTAVWCPPGLDDDDDDDIVSV